MSLRYQWLLCEIRNRQTPYEDDNHVLSKDTNLKLDAIDRSLLNVYNSFVALVQ